MFAVVIPAAVAALPDEEKRRFIVLADPSLRDAVIARPDRMAEHLSAAMAGLHSREDARVEIDRLLTMMACDEKT